MKMEHDFRLDGLLSALFRLDLLFWGPLCMYFLNWSSSSEKYAADMYIAY